MQGSALREAGLARDGSQALGCHAAMGKISLELGTNVVSSSVFCQSL